MFETLESAISELDVPGTGAALVEGFALLDRLTAKLTLAAAEFDASREWELDAATSAVAWLKHRAGMTATAAAWTVRTANRLAQLPVTASAWLTGGLTTGQVKAVGANVDDRTVSLFAEHEAEVVPALVPLSPRQTGIAMQRWRAYAEALLDGEAPRLPDRSLRLAQTFDGRFELSGSLDALSGEIVATALRLAMTPDAPGEPRRTHVTRQADAAVDICRFYIEHRHDSGSGRNRPHLNVVVDLDDLVSGRGGETIDGTLLSGAAIRTLLCDANVHRVVTQGRSAVLDYGNATRVVNPNLWSALVVRDRHCRFEGCDRPPPFCEAHHVVPVQDGGPTRLDNLVLKCSRHHHIGHLAGWHEKLLPDGTLVMTGPDGVERVTRPPGALPAAVRPP